jgi:hypothetical protein
MTTDYHWHACQDGNGWADLDIALSGECGYCRAGSASGASCTKGILAPESFVGVAERGVRPLVAIIFDAYSTRAHNRHRSILRLLTFFFPAVYACL